MSALKYPAYKDSGVQWLGLVPSHWDICPLKAVASCNDEVLPEDTDPESLIEYVEISGVDEGRGITDTETYTFGSAPSRARRVVRDGDVLISTVRTYLRAIATVENAPENLIASTGFAAIRPRRIHPRFLGYLLHCEYLIAEVIARSVGVSYPAINASELVGLKGPVPSVTEQAAIAIFLDRETSKIDALIEEQKRLVDLLKEKRQAAVLQAVTKGLDPTVPMKDSEVEGIGLMPAHWELKRLTAVCNFTCAKAHEPFFDDDGKYVCVTARFISTQGAATKYCTQNLSPARVGDILMVMSDLPNGRALARAYIISDDRQYAVNQRVCIISTIHGNAQFFYYQLDRNQQLLRYDDGVEQTHLSNHAFTKLRLRIPPEREQDAIANYLRVALADLGQLRSAAEEVISLLVERRAALISAAVTGKIDVRGLVPQPEAVAA